MNSLNRLSSSLRAVWKERNGVRKGDETDLSETQDEFQQEVRGKPKAGSRTTRGWVSFEGCIGGCMCGWCGELRLVGYDVGRETNTCVGWGRIVWEAGVGSKRESEWGYEKVICTM